jgi:chromosome segregation ATPase
MNYHDPLLILRKGEPDELERLRAEVERLTKELKEERAAVEVAAAALELTDWVIDKLTARAEAAEAALRAITRRVPIMGSTGDYRLGQLHALEACAEVARAALATGGAK